jgi:hypothetical protein
MWIESETVEEKKFSATRLSQFSTGDTPVSPASNEWLDRPSSSVRFSIGGRKIERISDRSNGEVGEK